MFSSRINSNFPKNKSLTSGSRWLFFVAIFIVNITQKQLRLTIMAICIGIVLTICVTISIFPSQTIDKFNAAVTNATQFVDNEDGNKKQPSGTASERFILWKVAINTARKHPFFGSGSGDFRLELERFTAAYPRYNVIGDSYRNELPLLSIVIVFA
jgi:O-antigen ligase